MQQLKQWFNQIWCKHQWKVRYVEKCIQGFEDSLIMYDKPQKLMGAGLLNPQKRIAIICELCEKEIRLHMEGK